MLAVMKNQNLSMKDVGETDLGREKGLVKEKERDIGAEAVTGAGAEIERRESVTRVMREKIETKIARERTTEGMMIETEGTRKEVVVMKFLLRRQTN